MGEKEQIMIVYVDGEPLTSISPVELTATEMEEAQGLPVGGDVTSLNRTDTLEGTIEMENLCAVAESIKRAWGDTVETLREVVEAFVELWRATMADFVDDWLWKKVIAWAEQNRRDLAGRYHNTKKRRTRKKYRKRIVEAYLKEVSGTVSEYTCGKPEYAMYQDGDYCPMETGEVEGCADCCYGVEKKEEAGE